MNVAVLIPNRNHAEVLGRAVESAQRQTMPPCEIVVVDDASTDDSRSVAKRHGVTLIARPEKAACWITALGEHVGSLVCDYVVMLGADDVLYEGCIENLCRVATAGPGVMFSDWQRMTYAGQPTEHVKSHIADGTCAIGDEAWRLISERPHHASGIGSMIRKDVLEWLYACGFARMGPWCDSTGYTAAAIVHGASWTTYVGAGFTHSGMPRQSYHLAAQADPAQKAKAKSEAHEFLHRAGLGHMADEIVRYWI